MQRKMGQRQSDSQAASRKSSPKVRRKSPSFHQDKPLMASVEKRPIPNPKMPMAQNPGTHGFHKVQRIVLVWGYSVFIAPISFPSRNGYGECPAWPSNRCPKGWLSPTLSRSATCPRRPSVLDGRVFQHQWI